MIVGPILQGGIKLVVENEKDWEVLKWIRKDASGDLAGRLSALMEEDSMWSEIVEPELNEEFSIQVKFVHLKVMAAFRNRNKTADADPPEIVIPKEDGWQWYGALNQARLAMEDKYHLGPRELRDVEAADDSELRSAYFREEFYLTMQSLLMRYVMD